MSRNQMYLVAANPRASARPLRMTRVHIIYDHTTVLSDIARQLDILLECPQPTGIHGSVGTLPANLTRTTKLLVWIPPSCI
jgi:hypothetical protein